MPYQETEFIAPDGLTLWARRWLPEGEPRAGVVLLHGFVEHGGRYAAAAEELNRHGYQVDAIDLRGHGRSAGPRAWVLRFGQYVDDAEAFCRHLRRGQAGLPRFLFGHSMGTLVAVRLALRRPEEFRGLVLSGLACRVAPGVFPWLRRLAPIASWVAPRLRVVRMGGRSVSRDPAVVDDFRRDPLVFHGRFPLRTGAEILRAGRETLRQAERLRVPLLVLHGTADRVTDPQGAVQFHARAGSPDKTLHLYDGLYHDLVHEPERAAVLADWLAWMTRPALAEHNPP